MSNPIPNCPVTIGQQVSFLELAEQPDQIARGYVVGMHWEPEHWLVDGWIVLVRCTELPLSPWIETEIDIELPADELIN